MRWAGPAARMGDRIYANRGLMEKSEGKKALGRPKHRWDSDIKQHV